MFAGRGLRLSLAYLRQRGTFSCYQQEQVLGLRPSLKSPTTRLWQKWQNVASLKHLRRGHT